jgi:hypothetical protein
LKNVDEERRADRGSANHNATLSGKPLLVVGLAEHGEEFVKRMRDDELSHRKATGQALFENELDIDQEVEDRLRTFLRDLGNKSGFDKTKRVEMDSCGARSLMLHFEIRGRIRTFASGTQCPSTSDHASRT